MDPANLHIVSLAHQRLPLATIGKFHLDESALIHAGTRFRAIGVEEFFSVITCNRAELVFVMNAGVTVDVEALLRAWQPGIAADALDEAVLGAQHCTSADAVRHLMAVAGSLESLVVGEREILAQVRDQYQRCKHLGFTGDNLRVLMKQVVVTAKRVYTETAIATRPVSVVSLAYRALRESGVRKDARFIVIGAGKTCGDMCRYLGKHGFKDLHIFNRTFSKAEALVKEVGGEAYPLDTLVAFDGGFDVIISGIGRGTPMVDAELFSSLAGSDRKPRVLVDLALPHDIAPDCQGGIPAHTIRIDDLQAQAEENKASRKDEIGACLRIVDEGVADHVAMASERGVERAMRSVPEEVKAIRERAVNEVFSKDLALLDPVARAVLEKVLDHMERKYISGPMRMAKEIMLEQKADRAVPRPAGTTVQVPAEA
ncbi:MAG: glutamyl-tRNA reductase [Flavobacteriales bacterium]